MGCFGQRAVSRLRKVNHSVQHWVRLHVAIPWPDLGSPGQKRHGYTGIYFVAGQQRYFMYYTTFHMRRGWESCACSAWRKASPWETLCTSINTQQHRIKTREDMKGYEGEKWRLPSLVPSDSTRGNGHKLKHRRFPWNIREHFFTVWVTQIVQRGSEVYILGDIQRPTEHSPGNLL